MEIFLKIPDNAHAFFESIKSECRKLIELGIWDIKISRFESWLNQFNSKEEEFFAACVLDQLIFRNAQQFEAGLKALFRSNLDGAINCYSHDVGLFDALKNGTASKLRIVPVIGESDPPTKSGPLVLRRLQKTTKIREKMMCWPWQAHQLLADKDIDKVIFIDDFLGSGEQFEKFFNQWKFNDFCETADFYYVTVVAHETGLEHLKSIFPKIRIIFAEALSSKNNFFDVCVWEKLGQGVVTAEEAKNWYLQFANEKGILSNNVRLLGNSDMALPFGFSHSTPNNSLPVLWFENQKTGWKPLLER
jgi:hypothetical protein